MSDLTIVRPGDLVDHQTLVAASGQRVPLPDASRLVHLQFRRYSGCAFCNIHLRAYEVRHDEIAAAGIHEVVVFRSTAEQLERHHSDIPFTVILDPGGVLYRKFGVTSGVRSILDPRAAVKALPDLLRSLAREGVDLPGGPKSEGLLGFPADFLIGIDGRLLACDFGDHAAGGWMVDQLLAQMPRTVPHATHQVGKERP